MKHKICMGTVGAGFAARPALTGPDETFTDFRVRRIGPPSDPTPPDRIDDDQPSPRAMAGKGEDDADGTIGQPPKRRID